MEWMREVALGQGGEKSAQVVFFLFFYFFSGFIFPISISNIQTKYKFLF
jgi:hypothetical protein